MARDTRCVVEMFWDSLTKTTEEIEEKLEKTEERDFDREKERALGYDWNG